jgi:hypothetical protein
MPPIVAKTDPADNQPFSGKGPPGLVSPGGDHLDELLFDFKKGSGVYYCGGGIVVATRSTDSRKRGVKPAKEAPT